MRHTLIRLWQSEQGFTVSTELVLMATVLVIGMVVGIVTLRDQIVQEFGDTSVALSCIQQSYSFGGETTDGGSVAGSSFRDRSDFCDNNGFDPPGGAPACIVVTEPPSEEG